ncbi:putative glycosyl transferase [Carbonactinospora thermoautotrophica]|uniref:Putative glycosyl transferase n=1 Tax=Carbonactinospora thermoautotrophica TaxID=1469144 RepID=A0A132MLN6_9ACTN|nr:glycosyltransferase [Carbonactinospora thermoautotrophica]KWW98665.1 putative glycosyl transferase [Carbonactinospora thermoautotrophica]
MSAYTATIVRRRVLLGVAIVICACVFWSFRHVASMIATAQGQGAQFAVVYTLAFVMLVWQMVLCLLERPRKVTPRQQRMLDDLQVWVNIPVYNEDPRLLEAALLSLLNQTRKPQVIHVVDDCSNGTMPDGTKVDYTELSRRMVQAGRLHGVEVIWDRQPYNMGKRQAQGVTARRLPKGSIFVTVDSDSMLDPRAIEEILKPFADPEVMSVAGVVLASNNRKNLLARLTDLWFVTGQLVDRSSMSTMGAVLVNSGPLAAYRAEVLTENLDGYLNESFFGRHVEFSDDSMLTLYALQRGKAVQQPSAFAFTAMPETLGHHVRQYLRWMRGAFIRTWWRFKYLPLNSYAYWGHLIAWVQMVLSTVIFVTLFVVQPVLDRRIIPTLLLIPLLIAYGQGLRYLSIRRSDESLGSQLYTYALTPLAALWAFFVLRLIRWYAMLTCLKTGWGTRKKVEVAA